MKGPKPTPPIVLVLAKVDVSAGRRACHPFTGGLTSKGYGLVSRRVGVNKRRNTTAHHVVLEHKLGRPLLPGMEACHTCDNPPCCNELHLFEGTTTDNRRDAIAKARGNIGERNGSAKLTDDQVDAIRRDTRPVRTVAEAFGVSERHIRRIRGGVNRSRRNVIK